MNALARVETISKDIPSKDQQEIQKVVDLPELYRDLKIKTHDDCQAAADILKDAKTKVKALEERRKLITKPLDDAKASVMELFRPATTALTQLEKTLKPKISKFIDDQEAARRKIEAEAEEKARIARDKLEAKAEKMRDNGKTEQAEALEMRAATTVASAPAVYSQKISSVSVRKTWVADVTDTLAVCRAIADGLLPPTIIEFKQAELNRLAATWQNTRAFDGLNIYQKSGVASR